MPWKATLPFAINLVANLAFTPIQFGLRSLFLAAADILIVWGKILWMMIVIYKHYRWVAFAQIPLSIDYRNLFSIQFQRRFVLSSAMSRHSTATVIALLNWWALSVSE